MSTDTPQPMQNPIWMTVLGWIIGILPALMLLAFGVMSQFPPPPENAAMFDHIGWRASSASGLGILMITGAVLYLFPRTAVLGAISLTGYLGGALATHVRIGDPLIPGLIMPLLLAVVLWFGLTLRDARLRAILPWRSPATTPAAAKGGFFSALGKIVLTIAVVVGLMAALLAAVAAEFRITRSITIDAPAAEVFPHVNDFHKWDAWTPWKKLDPTAKITFEGPSSGPGAVYKWAGNDAVGEGMMTILESKPDELIKIKLQFFTPMDSTGETVFTFKPDGAKTVVTWTRTGEREYKLRAICALLGVDKIVGDQFEEGLTNLKTVVEKKDKK